MKFFEKIKKNLKIFKVCWLLWKRVPAFWNFPGFGRGGDVPPAPTPEPLLLQCVFRITKHEELHVQLRGEMLTNGK